MRGSLRRKMMLVAMLTTGCALLLSATALLIYELRTFRAAWVADLSTQAELVALSSSPALAFDDRKTARETLALLRLRPQISAAALYDARGAVFAQYTASSEARGALPERPGGAGYRFEGDDLELIEPVRQGDEVLGTLYLRAHYRVTERLLDYLLILALVTLAGLGLAALVFSRLQKSVTQPILAVAAVAGEVMQRRDYRLRAVKTSDDEAGVLVDAFNNMLQEVGRRSEALERSNRELSQEMAERQRAEAALKLADRRKDEFLATLAHELRNPLAPLANGLELLKRADAAPAVREQARGIMERQLRQMVRLIDDLIEVSRITTGKLELQREPLDLLPVLRGAIEATEPTWRARAHALETHWPAGPLWIDADPARLAQVFGNLLNNAARYTDPGGRIEVAVEPDAAAQAVDVHVIDNGRGIDPTQQQAIFGMFMQVDQSLERGRAGLGVGLTLARQLVELHGGSLRVASEGLGKGSRFTVRLPLGRASAAAAGVAEQDAPAPASPALRVLVADDNADFADSLASMLEALGHRVRVVRDGQEALAAASADLPDVGLFDIGMPGLNGYELARRLRGAPATEGLLLVAITGWGQPGDRERARDAGFDHHLVKPVEFDAVLSVLAQAQAAARPH